jgi:hypothetical protein
MSCKCAANPVSLPLFRKASSMLQTVKSEDEPSLCKEKNHLWYCGRIDWFAATPLTAGSGFGCHQPECFPKGAKSWTMYRTTDVPRQIFLHSLLRVFWNRWSFLVTVSYSNVSFLAQNALPSQYVSVKSSQPPKLRRKKHEHHVVSVRKKGSKWQPVKGRTAMHKLNYTILIGCFSPIYELSAILPWCCLVKHGSFGACYAAHLSKGPLSSSLIYPP